MTKEEIFETWAPPGGRWSPWVKPVLFACIDHEPLAPAPVPADMDASWIPPAEDNVAVVLDLPGADGVWTGVAAAARGYCPVPLYNAVPGPTTGEWIGAFASLVDVAPIVAALWHGTPLLLRTRMNPESPPAFLLDANRRGEGSLATPGRFDNRSISFTTDFPSATFLAAHGIRRAVLVQSTGDHPQPDLAHTLRRWQDGGIVIELKQLDASGPPIPIEVRKPSGFGFLWNRALRMLGLRRHRLGGFGGFVPEPSAG
jgi:hypothetical protein